MKSLMKRIWEVYVHGAWLRCIKRTSNKLDRLKYKYDVQKFVLQKLVEGYHEKYPQTGSESSVESGIS